MASESITSWEDPPPIGRHGGDQTHRYSEVVHGLKNNQGKWALLEPRDSVQAAKSLSANIRKGRLASFAPPGAFESTYLGTKVWVRYIGEPENARTAPKKIKTDPHTASAVRTWARSNGEIVSDRGPISADLVARWRMATKGQELEAL